MMRRGIIEDIRVFPLEIPLLRPVTTARATQEVARVVLVEVIAEWVSGFGEADPRPHITRETSESVLAVLRDHLIPGVVGKSIFDIAAIHRAMAVVDSNPAAKSAIDVAVYDAVGKTLGVPVRDLLGGNAGRRLVLNAWCGIETDCEQAVDRLVEKVRSGFGRAVKVKVGVDEERECRLLELLSEALPSDIELIIDANQAWTQAAAAERLAHPSHQRVTICEQPVPSDDLAGMRQLAGEGAVRLMADESAWTARDVLRLALTRSATMVNLKLLKCGGIFPATKFLAVAEAAGMGCMIGSTVQTSVSALAQLHLAAASEVVDFIDIVKPAEFLVADIAEGFHLDGGEVILSDKPGLGLDIDRAAIERFRVEL